MKTFAPLTFPPRLTASLPLPVRRERVGVRVLQHMTLRADSHDLLVHLTELRLNCAAQLRQRPPLVQAGSFWFICAQVHLNCQRTRPNQRPRRSSTFSRALPAPTPAARSARTDFRHRVAEAQQERGEPNDERILIRFSARCAHRIAVESAQMQLNFSFP